jgi:hypothetical protein
MYGASGRVSCGVVSIMCAIRYINALHFVCSRNQEASAACLAFNSETPQARVLLCTLLLVTDSDSEVSAALPRTLDAEPSHRPITFKNLGILSVRRV